METKTLIEKLKLLLEFADTYKSPSGAITVDVDDSFYEIINGVIEKLEGID